MGALCSILLAGCGVPEVTYRLRFPSEETFLVSTSARVEVYDGAGEGDESPDAICRKLSVLQPVSVPTLASSGLRDVCAFRDPGLPLSALDAGRYVFAASTVDENNTTILQGCAVVDLHPEFDEIEIQLSTLPAYPASPVPRCASIEDKCGGTCEASP